MNAKPYDNTPEYLENQMYEILTAQRKYNKTGLIHLMKHINEEELLHPTQIKFIVKNLIQSALYFEDKAMETYNNLPDKTKAKLEHYYQNNIAFVSKEVNATRQTPPEIVQAFNDRQAEIYDETYEKAVEYLENN